MGVTGKSTAPRPFPQSSQRLDSLARSRLWTGEDYARQRAMRHKRGRGVWREGVAANAVENARLASIGAERTGTFSDEPI